MICWRSCQIGNEVIIEKVIESKMNRYGFDVGSVLVKVNKPSGRIVKSNVDEEAGVRVVPEICEPIWSLAGANHRS